MSGPKGSPFDWITPLIGEISHARGKQDFFYDLSGMSGYAVFDILKRAGCRPVRFSLSSDGREMFVSVDDAEEARLVMALELNRRRESRKPRGRRRRRR